MVDAPTAITPVTAEGWEQPLAPELPAAADTGTFSATNSCSKELITGSTPPYSRDNYEIVNDFDYPCF